jgi:hypothetical protein
MNLESHSKKKVRYFGYKPLIIEHLQLDSPKLFVAAKNFFYVIIKEGVFFFKNSPPTRMHVWRYLKAHVCESPRR